MRARTALTVLATLGSMAAQRGGRPKLEITLPPAAALATGGPSVRAMNVLSEPAIRDLLDSGFPARLHFRAELWSSGGLFNSLRASTVWDLIVRYAALGKRYRLVRVTAGRPVSGGQFA